jgi:serine/threonine protein kinase
METGFSSSPIKPHQKPDASNKPDEKKSSVYQDPKVTKKDPFSVQEIDLSGSESDTESVGKTTATALPIIQQLQNKGEALKILQEKVKIVYSSYSKEQVEQAKKAELSLNHFISAMKTEIELPEKSSGFQHYTHETGLKLEHYPEGKLKDFALLKVFLGEGANKIVKMSVDLNAFKPAARAAVDISDINVARDLNNEIDIQSQLEGPEFLEILATCNYVGKNLAPKMGIMMPYCEKGNLSSFSKKYLADTSPEVQATNWRFAKTLLSGLKKMSEKNIHHGDLKPENLMVSVDDSGTEQLKIADFGYANFMGKSDVKFGRGSPNYLPPEILEGLILKDDGVTKIEEGEEEVGKDLVAQAAQLLVNSKGDIWAAGLILLELRSALLAPQMNILLNAEEVDELFVNLSEIKQDSIKKLFSKELNTEGEINTIEDLIYQMLQVDPQKRISPEKAWEAFQMLEKNNSNFCMSEEALMEWAKKPPRLIEKEIETKEEL